MPIKNAIVASCWTYFTNIIPTVIVNKGHLQLSVHKMHLTTSHDDTDEGIEVQLSSFFNFGVRLGWGGMVNASPWPFYPGKTEYP